MRFFQYNHRTGSPLDSGPHVCILFIRTSYYGELSEREETGDVVKQTRVILGALPLLPWRSQEVEDVFTGKQIDSDTVGRANVPRGTFARSFFSAQP